MTRALRDSVAAAAAIILVGASAWATSYRFAESEPTKSSQVTAAHAEPSQAAGMVVAVSPQWKRDRIVSRVVLMSDSGTPSVFEVPGGSVGGIMMRVGGAPRFSIGERVQVVLRKVGETDHLVGLGTGKEVLN